MPNGLLNSLIAYWGLDESGGANNALDKHSNSLTLTQSGSPGSGTGKVYSGARTFSGSGQYFQRTSSALLQTGDVDFTVAAWVYLTDTSYNSAIVGKFSGGTNSQEWLLYYNYNDWTPGNCYTLIACPASGNIGYDIACRATTFGAPTVNSWHLVILWHDATNQQLGICIDNGTPDTVAQPSYALGIYAGNAPFEIGTINNSYNAKATIGPVAFWKSSAGSGGMLTSAQRTALYNSGNGLAYASFDNGTTADIVPAWLGRRPAYAIDSWR